jgi:serine/threonine protein kinase
MEWVAGKQLQDYVEDHLREPKVLGRLADRWRGVVSGLGRVHIAHGDLQHGNILVDSQGQIRLVDYDGFFIPPLQGHPPDEEVGHANYQHAERIRWGYYEENVDGFSALVIYLSLLALKADPGLWDPTFHSGDNLVFSARDFKKPGLTPLWSRLKKSPEAEVRRLTAELENFCRGPVSAVPHLEAVLHGAASARVQTGQAATQVHARPQVPIYPAANVVVTPPGQGHANSSSTPNAALFDPDKDGQIKAFVRGLRRGFNRNVLKRPALPFRR